MLNRIVPLLVVLSFACATKPPQLAYCPPAPFANCTQARCTLQSDGNYLCWCVQDTRYSATMWAGSQSASCKDATSTYLQSRYHPTTAYQECDSKAAVQTWAWCLGVSCKPSTNPDDPNSNENIACTCIPIPSGVQAVPYIVTTNTYNPDNCAFKYWSSATPSDVAEATSFLQKQPGLSGLKPPTLLKPPK
jgi:hypothetical protein